MATKPSLGLTDSTLHSCEDHLGLASVTSRTRGGGASHILKIIRRTVAEFFQDSIPTVAGGITFFFLLALFPAIASVVSFYGLFASRSEIVHDIDLLAGFLPGGALSVLRTALLRLSKETIEPNLAFFAGSLVAIWSASGGYSAMVEGLNVAYEVKETRSFWRLTANAVFFTLLAIVAGSLALNLGLILPYWIEANTRTDEGRLIVQLIVWLLSFAVFAVIIALAYNVGPNHPKRPMQWVNWGSLLASALWLAGTRLFTWYAENYGSYDRVYGALGGAVGFLTWVWLSFAVVLLGAELNCELERPEREPQQ